MRLPPLQVTMEDRRPVVAAEVNGIQARFIIDSGSFFDFLSPAAAAELKLPLTSAPPWYYVSGVGGSFIPKIATAKTFTLDGFTGRNALFLVGNNDFQGGVAGILGQNILRFADIDYDFADGTVRFVEAQHCDGQMLAYWATTQPVGVVAIHWTSEEQSHLLGKASVNGHNIDVVFDTGAGRTILSLAAAKRAGITPDTPGVVPAGESIGMGDKTVKVWVAPIAKFEIGGESIERTHVLIGDIGLERLGADMLLGADFFLAHHIYVAYSQNKLYFTYNGGPVFDLNTQPPAHAKAPAANGPGSAARTGGSADGRASDDSNASASIRAAAATPAPATADPTDAAGFMRRGMASASRGEFAQAITELTDACELQPKDAACRYQRGLAYWHNHNPQLALADFNEALSLAPDDYAAHLARAELQLSQKQAGVAGDLDAVDRLAPQDADLRLRLAMRYDSIGQYAAAAHQLDLWIQYHPQDVRLSDALGMRCGARGSANVALHEALADCDRAMHEQLAAAHSAFWRLTHRDAPGPGWLLGNRSLVYLRLGDLDKAIADDDTALGQIDPKSDGQRAHVLYLRGLAELRTGLKPQAEADLAAARKLQPDIDKHYSPMGLTP